MSSLEAEVVLPCHTRLGEGALWDEIQQVLYFVDIVEGRVFRFDPRRGHVTTYQVGEDVGTVVLCLNHKLLLALRSGFASFDPINGTLHRLPSPSFDGAVCRFNDGKCDPRGRFWAGTYVEKPSPRQGALYCLDPVLDWSEKLENVRCSNGLAFSRDTRTLYYIDSHTQQIWAFQYDIETATLGAHRVVFEFPRVAGAPDGMTIDERGRLWVALFRGARVVCVNPETSVIEFEVRLPVTNVSSCTFGGWLLDELYITTASIGLESGWRSSQPLAGSLFRVRLPFRGVSGFRFARAL